MTHGTLNRREFLGAASASVFAFHYVPPRAFGANERLDVAAIGVGGKGASDVSDVAAEGCNIVALCDVDAQRAAETFGKFPKAKRYADFCVMLEQEPGIDAVIVSTPDHTHAPASVMTMRMGKHVYCQKPLTHSIHEARVMAQVAAETGVATQMGNQGHAGEGVRRGVEMIRAGVIGAVHEVHTWTNRPVWPQGLTKLPAAQPVPGTLNWDLWLGPAPDRPYNAAYLPFNWRGWWDFGTGALGDMACHIMDLPYWALELGAPTAVEAVCEGNTALSPPTTSTITYEFPSRGSRPPVKLVWYDGHSGTGYDNAPTNIPPREVIEPENVEKYGCALIGEKGKLYFHRNSTDWRITPESILEDFVPPEPSIPRVKNEDAEWIAACKGGPAALSNFAHSGPFTEMVLLGNLSIRLGKKIEWDAANTRCPNAPEADEFIHREYRPGWTL